MENLNAEQVKRGLECCNTIGGCKVCPYSCNGKPTDNGECGEKMSLDALALINKQETEYNELYELLQTYKADSEAYRSYSKTLEKENESLKTLLNESYDTQNSLTEENKKLTINMNAFGLTAKRLGEENESLRAENEMLLNIKNLNLDKVIADTVWKMQERLNKRFGRDKNRVHTDYIVHRYIDQIAKEILEGTDNG